MASVALVLVQVVAVIEKLATISPYFASVTLPNVLPNLVTVVDDIVLVSSDFSRALAQISAFRSRTVLVSAPARGV